MSRERTGTAVWHGNHWDVQLTLPDGSRSNRACLAVGVSEDDARAEAQRLTEVAIAEGWTRETTPKARGPKGNTFDVYAEAWLKTRRDPKEADAHLRVHVFPLLINHVTTEIAREDVERVVQALDDKVRAGELSWKTASNVWGTVSKLFDDATNAKRLELRVLEHNPVTGVRGPDRGDEKQSAYLFPKEAAALLACADVPRRWRTIYALALYTGLRRGELAVLKVGDVVLDAGYLSVAKAHDRVTKGEKSTKGRRARRVPIEPELTPLLEQLTKDRDAGEVLVDMPPQGNMASKLREHLERARLTRAELHADDEHRRPFSFHDCRHVYATWLALRGEPADVIQQYLGHATAEMTQRYVEEARAVGRGDIGIPFGPLPSSLLEGTPMSPERPANRTAIALAPRNSMISGGADGTRTRGLRRDRPAL